MRRPPRLYLGYLLVAGLSGSLVLAQPPKSNTPPDLSGFKTVDTCIKTKATRSTAPEPAATQIPYLGVHIDTNKAGQAIIVEIEADSPAAKAGLQPNDVVKKFGATEIKDAIDLRDALKFATPNQKTKLALLRKDKPLGVEVTLAAVSAPLADTPTTARAVLGIQVDPGKEGVKITEITKDGGADKAGVQVGDVLLKADDKAITSLEDLVAFLGDRKPGDIVKLALKRDGKDKEIKATLGSADQGRATGRGSRGGWDERQARAWTKDVYRLGVITIAYPDAKPNPNVATKDWEAALFSKGVYNQKSATGQKVHGSMNDYYREISCGKFRVEGKAFAAVEVKYKRETYGAAGANRYALLTEAMDKLLERDGKDALKDIDGIFFMYAGNRVQTQRGGLYWPHRASFNHNNKRWSYFICPEGGKEMASISVITHEFGHMLGMPDLYARPETPGAEGVGVWCTMSTGHGRDGKPLHFSAWCKEQLGWLNPAVIDPRVKQKLVLKPIENSDKECYKVLLRPDGAEYLLLENRVKKGYDEKLPGEGMLIWRIVNGRPVLEESHGVLGPNGPQRYLGSVPYPSKSNTAFTPYTQPSSKPLSGGGLPVHITNIRRLADGSITFYIGYEYF